MDVKRVLAIDPGSSESGWVLLDGERVVESGKSRNDAVLALIRDTFAPDARWADVLVIERFQARGPRPIDEYSIETVLWTGRFWQLGASRAPVALVKRTDVKRQLCGTVTAKDSAVTVALVDRYGGIGGRAAAVGVKAKPGPLYGVKADAWAALAVGLTYQDQLAEGTR